jgi:hypothetical protein
MGFEPMNTGFAEPKSLALSGIYGNPSALKSTEKYASDSTSWVENGLKIFLGKVAQYPSVGAFTYGCLANPPSCL